MNLRGLVRDRESIERFLHHQNLWTEPLGPADDSITATMCPLQLLDQELKAQGRCLSESKGVSSFKNPYPTLRYQASVGAIPPLRAAFRASRHRRHVLKGVSGPRGAVYPIASPPGSPRSV